MPSYYACLGISHQRRCIEYPQQKSTVERKHRHLLNINRSLLFNVNLPIYFWYFSLCHATYLIIKLCSLIIHNHTLYKIIFKELPSLTHLETFSCLTYATIITRKQYKLDHRATKGLFLGYPTGIKGCLLFDLHTRSTFIS